jgi:SAM-dependent methyltransferase
LPTIEFHLRYLWLYFRYFIYIGWNWNFRLALFILINEIRGEHQYQLRTSGIDHLTGVLSQDQLAHASIYQPVNFFTAEQLFQQLQPDDYRTGFVDAGCGKGRVMAMAAQKGFRNIYAFDIAAPLCIAAAVLAEKLEQQFSSLTIQVDCIDAAEYAFPDDAGVVFLFNPFDDHIMKSFAASALQSLQRKPRPLKILYANPVHAQVWLNIGFTERFHFRKMRWLEGSIFEFEPKNN